MRKLRVGDTAIYRPFGVIGRTKAKVENIDICDAGNKYGRSVMSCDLDKHLEVVIALDNQTWCYAEQIHSIKH